MDFQQLVMPILARLIGTLAEEALTAAIEAARRIALDPSILSNSQRKRQLIKELKSNLPNLKASVINLLAELAVSAMKQESLAGQA
jgi:hypothetical protein